MQQRKGVEEEENEEQTQARNNVTRVLSIRRNVET